MSEVLLYKVEKEKQLWRSGSEAHGPDYRAYSKLSTCTAPRVVLYS